jgi:hypothetical protein
MRIPCTLYIYTESKSFIKIMGFEKSLVATITVQEEFDQLYADNLHCKEKIHKFWNKYFQKRNIGVSFPISTFMGLWAIYIFPHSICLFCWRKYVDRSWDYINRSQTNACWNWGWGRAIPRKGIHKCVCCIFYTEMFSWSFISRKSTLQFLKSIKEISRASKAIKAVTNEKQGGPGRWQMIDKKLK